MPKKRFSIDDYCAMEDSTVKLKIRDLSYTFIFYVSTIVWPDNSHQSLWITRPRGSKYSRMGSHDLRSFLIEYASDKRIIACGHYKMYEWMVKEFDVDFITKSTQKEFPSDLKRMYEYAHQIAYADSEFALKLFTKSGDFEENRKKLLEAIRQGDDSLNLGVEFKIRGLYISKPQNRKPKYKRPRGEKKSQRRVSRKR